VSRRIVWIAVLAATLAAAFVPTSAQTDLDALMATVIARRDDSWKTLKQYILDEHRTVELVGPGSARVWGEQRDDTWFIEDGYFVRSPVAVNGVAIGDAARRTAEAKYLERVKHHDAEAADAATADEPGDVNTLIRQTRQPDFISSSYFLNFKIDRGRYAFVGREQLDGREVLRIEYYPTKLFSDNPAAGNQRRRDRNEGMDRQVARLMDKTSVVTIWVDPSSDQIVKYLFDNVGMDFLPGAWLVQATGARGTMEMHQVFPGVWLPVAIDLKVSLQLAIGDFDVNYRVRYDHYRRAQTSGRLVLPVR
jgi:hypothetical protein